MTLKEGASYEILSRWPEHKQRNVGISYEWYGREYADGMSTGIQLIRGHYAELKAAGATEWIMPDELRSLIDAQVFQSDF